MGKAFTVSVTYGLGYSAICITSLRPRRGFGNGNDNRKTAFRKLDTIFTFYIARERSGKEGRDVNGKLRKNNQAF